METKKNFKKLFLNENLEPIIQKNSDGVIIIYSSNKEEIRYELTYHYLFGKLISISQKDLKGRNNKKYSIISLIKILYVYANLRLPRKFAFLPVYAYTPNSKYKINKYIYMYICKWRTYKCIKYK